MSRPPSLPQIDRILNAPRIDVPMANGTRSISLPESGTTTPRPSPSRRAAALGGSRSRPSSPTLHPTTQSDHMSKPYDVVSQLHKSALSIVKTRQGSVLARGFVLKTDYYESGKALEFDVNLHGAPVFRQNKSSMNVFGVAQSRRSGIKAVLSLLGCRPNAPNRLQCHWLSTREEVIVYISGRPFVLRDSTNPRESVVLTDRTKNLEETENRLKKDILAEAAKFSGVILTHHELDSGDIIPSWIAADEHTVKTQKEIMEQLKEDGWGLEYYRIPITQDRLIEDNYVDAFVDVIKGTNPHETPLVFSCGAGAVRTTFSMTAACIIRRRQLVLMGAPDPYSAPDKPPSSGIATPRVVAELAELATVQQEVNRSLLRITYILQEALPGHDSRSAIELLMGQPQLMSRLQKAYSGMYSVVLSLLACLEQGTKAKRLVDRVIDDCDHVLNLREEALIHRIRYALTNMDDKSRASHLDKALRSLEHYFFMIAFASYVEEQTNWSSSFSDWMKARTEVWNQVEYLRRSKGLKILAPVSDLSAISKVEASRNLDVRVSGGQSLGDEYSEHVIQNRNGIVLRQGTLLKSDIWRAESRRVADSVRGAINFRNVPGTNVYCLGQPTKDAITVVLDRVIQAHPEAERVVWITLREEPLVYINGSPYCLRSEASTLRNVKDYGGISSSRLEALEDRLKADVLKELSTFGQSILLHTENSEGVVIPVWEEVEPNHVEVLKEVMAETKLRHDIPFQYHRIPITSEAPPDFSDISELMDVVIKSGSDRGVIVVNCQLGRGRSTLTSILILLIQRWIQASRPTRPMSMASVSTMFDLELERSTRGQHRQSYQVINNVLRVIRNGLKVKEAVDDAIDQCGGVYNLRESIESLKVSADQAGDARQKYIYVQRAFDNLRRYFELILFEAYLQSTPPDTPRSTETFESYVKNRPVFKTLENDMEAEGEKALNRLERIEVAEGIALPDEVATVVANRSGDVLSGSTMLKSDYFSNLQKMSLPERIDGAPNFRELPLLLDLPEELWSPLPGFGRAKGMTCVGTGMPQTDGARRVLARLFATIGKKRVFWTSLREEPVIYVVGRPHVLRLITRPLRNVEATGITTDVVETMEKSLRYDVQREIRKYEGRILLHDEIEDPPGHFTVTAQWERATMADVMTPKELFAEMRREGFQVDYARVAITDEQAPLPDALSLLMQRVVSALHDGDVVVQNCQMGRGRTTSGMVVSCLVATISHYDVTKASFNPEEEGSPSSISGIGYTGKEAEERAFMQGEYKTILQLVGVLSHGKIAKQLTDMAVDQMEGVQNLRKAIFDNKIKAEAAEPGTSKYERLMEIGVNYLYRYGALIVLANYLIEWRTGETGEVGFADWLKDRREIKNLLSRRNLD